MLSSMKSLILIILSLSYTAHIYIQRSQQISLVAEMRNYYTSLVVYSFVRGIPGNKQILLNINLFITRTVWLECIPSVWLTHFILAVRFED